MTWPVASAEEARRSAAWGVNGVITRARSRPRRAGRAGGDGLTAVRAGAARRVGRERARRRRPAAGALALLFHVANHVLRSVAWRNVLAAAYPAMRVPLLPIAGRLRRGVALNAVAPARGGDAVKVALARGALPGSSVPDAGRDDLRARHVRPGGRDRARARRRRRRARAGAARARRGRCARPLARRWAGLAAPPGVAAGRARAPRLRALVGRVRQGGADPAHAGRYLRRVALVQAAAWACRSPSCSACSPPSGCPPRSRVAGAGDGHAPEPRRLCRSRPAAPGPSR